LAAAYSAAWCCASVCSAKPLKRGISINYCSFNPCVQVLFIYPFEITNTKLPPPCPPPLERRRIAACADDCLVET
jgi:hypothetical protein